MASIKIERDRDERYRVTMNMSGIPLRLAVTLTRTMIHEAQEAIEMMDFEYAKIIADAVWDIMDQMYDVRDAIIGNKEDAEDGNAV